MPRRPLHPRAAIIAPLSWAQVMAGVAVRGLRPRTLLDHRTDGLVRDDATADEEVAGIELGGDRLSQVAADRLHRGSLERGRDVARLGAAMGGGRPGTPSMA